MTAPEFREAAKSRVVPVTVTICVLLIVVNYALLIPLLKRQAEQSRAGADARVRQCVVQPIATRVYRWIESQGVITEAELRLFLKGAPSPQTCAAVLSRQDQ